jgi:hypothetical protein
MTALLLLFIGTFGEEVSLSMGKSAVKRRLQSPYTMVFLSLFWGVVFFVVSLLFGKEFTFTVASLPTFGLRLLIEMVISYTAIMAVIRADRSTCVFMRLITIPLLVLSDLRLGYSLSSFQLAGIVVICTVLVGLLSMGKISRKGLGYCLFTSIMGAATITLYKYNISHFNTVAGEQIMMHGALLVWFTVLARLKTKENPWSYLLRLFSEEQSIAKGLGSFLISHAYNLAPASVVVTADRSLSIFWGVIFGHRFFHERNFGLKLVAFGGVACGLYLLTK